MLVSRSQYPYPLLKLPKHLLPKEVHAWSFNSMKVSLINNDDHLECILINEGKKIKSKIDYLPDAGLEEHIKYLTEKCIPIVTNEAVSFKPFIQEWQIDSGKVFLLKSNNSLTYVFISLDKNQIQGPIPIPEDRNINECVEYLITCIPEVIGETVSFAPPTPIHQWASKDRIVYLFKTRLGIDCKIVNKDGSSSQIPLSFKNSAEIKIKDAIQYLKGCEPILIDDIINFLPVCHKWTWHDDKIQLLRNNSNTFFPNDQLIWQVFNEMTKESTYLRLCKARLCRDHEILEIADFEYLKDCKIAKLEENLIYFEPIVFPSRFDNNIILKSNQWAVTLINTSTAANDPRTWYGHAGIMIEGIKNGSYFSQFADLIAKDGGCVRLQKGEGISSFGKTRTFLVERSKVEVMLEEIKEEIALQEKGEPIVSFALCGFESWITRLGLLVTYLFNNKEFPIHEIFDSYEDMVKNTLGCEPCTLDSVIWDLDQNNDLVLEATSDKRYKLMLKHQQIELQISKLLNEEKIKKIALKNELTTFRCVKLVDGFDCWFESNNPKRACMGFPDLVVSLQGEHKGKWAKLKRTNNCISWARSKLFHIKMILNEPLSTTAHSLIQKPMKYSHENGIVDIPFILDCKEKCLNTPLEIQEKALELDEKYLKELESVIEQSTSIPHRPKKTFLSLISEESDAYTFLWLASRLETTGIAREVREFLINKKDISSMKSALHLACALNCYRELCFFLEYVNIEAMEEENEKLIDTILLNIENEMDEARIICTFLILLNNKIISNGIFFTRFYKDENFRNTIFAELDKKGFVDFKKILERQYFLSQEKEIEIKKRACVIS